MISVLIAVALLGQSNPAKPLFPEIAFEIIAMGMADQEARFRLIDAMKAEPGGASMSIALKDTSREDQLNTTRMKQIVEQIGWPTQSKVGTEASGTAWLLVQHADADPEFQSHCLELMRPYLGKGEINEQNYAYLWDRVAINSGGKQRYGTQVKNEGGRWIVHRLENPRRVEEFRRQVGLMPLTEYLKLIETMYGPPSDD
ncbi:MAG: hypothetical protein KF812_04060 [Fimbriimonadaceae bacterium]|nr:hypothetical protein [Fimbriimonadaceae bacterium]